MVISQDMKKCITILFFIICNVSYAQTQLTTVDTIENKINGFCNEADLYIIINGFGYQQEAKCPISNNELTNRLEELQFFQENPKFKGEKIIKVDINCNGEVVNVESKFSDSNLNRQIIDMFFSLGNYTPGKIQSKNVDSSVLYSLEIKKGELILNNNKRK